MDVADHHRHPGQCDAISDGQMTTDADRTTDDAVFADFGAACDADFGGDGCACTNADIMRDLHQIVDDDMILNDSVIDSPAIDASMTADANMIADTHPTQLCDALPLHLSIAKYRRKTKSLRADIGMTMDAHMITDDASMMDDSTGIDVTLRTDTHTLADNHTLADRRACTDRHTFFDDGIGRDADIR